MRHAATSFPSSPPGCDQLPLERLTPRQTLRRQESRGSLEALAESIRRYGVMQPVTVRKAAGGRYLVVSGNRRLAACRMLGLACIPVRVLSDDARHMPADQLLDALLMHRMHYLEEAEALCALKEVHGMEEAELARTLARPLRAVTLLMQLREMDDELCALLLEEGVPAAIAVMLMRLSGSAQRMEGARRIVRERLCIRDAGLLIASMQRALKAEAAVQKSEKENRVTNREECDETARNDTRIIKRVIRDQRPYLNAIRDIARQMESAGFRPTLSEQRVSGQLEMTITIPLRHRRMDRYQSM